MSTDEITLAPSNIGAPPLEEQRDELPPSAFDFAAHGRAAISDYLPVHSFYENLSNVVARILEECLREAPHQGSFRPTPCQRSQQLWAQGGNSIRNGPRCTEIS